MTELLIAIVVGFIAGCLMAAFCFMLLAGGSESRRSDSRMGTTGGNQ